MSQNTNNSIFYKIRNFRKLYSFKDKDPQKLKDIQINNLIKKEYLNIFLIITAIVLQFIVFYYAAIFNIDKNPFLGDYTYVPSFRENTIYIAYFIAWGGILIIFISILLEIRFLINYANFFKKKPELLTIKKKTKANDNTVTQDRDKKSKKNVEINSNDSKDNKLDDLNLDDTIKAQKEIDIDSSSLNFKIGDLPIEKSVIKIGISIIVIIINIFAMGYYLTNPQQLPSFRMISTDVAKISNKDFFNFIMFMGIFLMTEIFLLISNIIGNFSRLMMLQKILYIRTQREFLSYLYKSNKNNLNTKQLSIKEMDAIITQSGEIESNIIKKKLNKEFEENNLKNALKPRRMNIYNSPIEKVKEEKLKLLEYKYKLAYLKEREKLLRMIEKDRLIALYGKKGYKEYIKEQKILKQKEGYIDNNSESKIEGYKIIKEKDKSDKIKKEIKTKIKEKKKDTKNKKIQKKEFDFR